MPLTILVDESLRHPSLDALATKGHHIVYGVPAADLILSKTAHWWHPALWEKPTYLEAALKAARRRRKEAKSHESLEVPRREACLPDLA